MQKRDVTPEEAVVLDKIRQSGDHATIHVFKMKGDIVRVVTEQSQLIVHMLQNPQ